MIRASSAWRVGAWVLAVCAIPGMAAPDPFDYRLKAQTVADGVHVFIGRDEHFSRDNGGNIVNTGYIVTGDGVVVIDTGPSLRYGRQMRAAIERETGQPVRQVYLTHAHPDHFLGNQAFADVPIAALPATAGHIRSQGDDLSANLYRMVGGWMEGTEAQRPSQQIQAGTVEHGGRQLRLIATSGHTDGDLAVYDERTRTLFAGDLVFFNRAPTTPNADLAQWLAALDELSRLDFAVLVPGHGPVVHDETAIRQTRDYLRWLGDSLREAARRGLDLNEVMRLPLPERFAQLAVVREEFGRSVVHLYPEIELEVLAPASP